MRTPVRKRRKGGPRRGPWRSVKYRRWIAEHSCLICRKPGTQAAHTERGGMSMKGPDSSCVPLCPAHHDQLDGRVKLSNGGLGRKAFEDFYRQDLTMAARWYFSVWSEREGIAQKGRVA